MVMSEDEVDMGIELMRGGDCPEENEGAIG